MNRDQAYDLVKDTFTQKFDKARFWNFAINLLKHVDASKASSWSNQYIKDAFKNHVNRYERLGTYTSPDRQKLDILVVHVAEESKLGRARIAIRNFVADHLKTLDEKDAALIAFVSPDEIHWRFSYVKLEYASIKKDSGKVGVEAFLSPARRYSYIVGENVNCHTAQTRFLACLQDTHDPTLSQIEDAFSVEAVTKEFFREIANWYFWALKHVRFPKDAPKEADGLDHVSVIRLITRLIFCWFVKEKGLIPSGLFDQEELAKALNLFAPHNDSVKESVYYKAILQNLFFATLNTEMEKRGWAREEQNFMAHTLYRHKECFRKPSEALGLFKNIPFLNGGLFECLDKDLGESARKRYVRVDGFSRRPDSQPTVPDFLFFGSERDVDLSAEYGQAKYRRVTVGGLIHTLNRYNFTIEENTPLDQRVALDPELSGKVFENLLAAYNPETGATARKQTGSFYTPREIVNFMADEALIAYFIASLQSAQPQAEEIETRLRHLLAYNDEVHQFTTSEVSALIAAIDGIKAIDPAVGSGAFPMGVLHKLVFVLGKLDPRNEQWMERQIQRVREAIGTAEKIEDASLRERSVRELELQVSSVKEAFERNELDYGRKLFLIENCIYGVDIQSIAVQIAKMRFFIALIVDQKIDEHAPNFGVRPLPNLETKFVAANSLIAVHRPGQQLLRNLEIDAKEAELRVVRQQHFNARTPTAKAKFRDQDARLRADIAAMLKNEGWDTATARKLASWDPYDQNTSADFFDSEWMFGLTSGFDIIIGNPPYIKEYVHRGAFEGVRNSPYYQGKMDIWYLFACIGIDLLKQNSGVLSFIATNNWTTNSGASKLRDKIARDCTILKLIDFGNYKVFESADIQTMVLICAKNNNLSQYLFDLRKLTSDAFEFEHLITLLQQSPSKSAIYLEPRFDRSILKGKPLVFSNNHVESLLSKIARKGTFMLDPKKEVAQGIVPPQDFVSKASLDKLGACFRSGDGIFIISNEEKRALSLTKAELEFVRPYYTTVELRKYYGSQCNAYWVIYTDSSFKNPSRIKPYPNLKRHLDQFKRVITSDNHPYGLHRSREERFFRGDKIISVRKCSQPTFTYTNFDCYVSQTFNIIKSSRIDLRYLTAILNSALVAFWLRHKGKMQGHLYQIDKEPLLAIPIFAAPHDQQKVLIALVDSIITARKLDPEADTTKLEHEIDQLVYTHYGLTPEEIKLVEGTAK